MHRVTAVTPRWGKSTEDNSVTVLSRAAICFSPNNPHPLTSPHQHQPAPLVCSSVKPGLVILRPSVVSLAASWHVTSDVIARNQWGRLPKAEALGNWTAHHVHRMASGNELSNREEISTVDSVNLSHSHTHTHTHTHWVWYITIYIFYICIHSYNTVLYHAVVTIPMLTKLVTKSTNKFY